MTDTTSDPRLFSRDPAERRAFLSEVGEGIAYFIPPELRSRLQFLAEMTPSAAVERAGSAARSAVRPGRTAGERIGDVGAMLSETAGVVAPAMVAGRAAMPAAEAVQEAFLGASVPARAAAETVFERLNQPGPMPETLYSNPPFDPAAFIRQHFGPERKAAADAQRLREELDANDQLRAERGLPPLNPPPRTADPAPRDFGFTQDNPGGDWLRNKQENADEAMAESSRGLRRRGITGSVTGTMGMYQDMFLPTDRLSGLTGLMDENRRPGDPRFDALLARVREEGFDPNQAGNRIVIAVNHRGEPFVLEGNTRIAVARELGIPNVRAEVRYWNGAEEVDGPFAPENVARIAARGPSGSRPENFAQGGAVMMRSSMPEQLHQGVGSLSEVARRMFGGGPVQYMQAGGPAVSYEPQRGGNFDTFATGSDLAIQMMREARDPMFYDGEVADRFLQAVPFGDAYYGEYTLEGAREDVGAPRRTEPGVDFFGRRSEPAVERQFEAANIRDMVQLLRYLESVPEDQLSARDRALRDEIPAYLASRTGM